MTSFASSPDRAPGELAPPRLHRLRRHPAQGSALRYLAGFRSQLTRVVLKAVERPGRPEFRVPVIGMLEGLSLLTECPAVPGGPALQTGEALEVRLFSVRDLVIFQSEVLAQADYPARYLHLAWPQELSVLPVRAAARVPIDKTATFTRTLDGHLVPVSGTVVDLSTRGAALLCDIPGAGVGDTGELVLVLEVDAQLPPVYVHPRCVVRSAREAAQPGACPQYGLEFVDLSLHDALAIRAFLGLRESGPGD